MYRNINGGDVQRKNVANNVDKSSLWTKWPVQKHTEHHKTRSKQGHNRHKEITVFCVFRFF